MIPAPVVAARSTKSAVEDKSIYGGHKNGIADEGFEIEFRERITS
jgi:hypothetical protein